MFTEQSYLGRIIKDSILKEIRDVQYLKLNKDISADKKVHEIRKAIKRMRSLLRLLKNSYLPRTYHTLDSLFGKAANKLSPMRDTTVNLETFLELVSQNPGLLPEAVSMKIARGLTERTVVVYQQQKDVLDHPLYLEQVMHFLQHAPFEEIGYENLLDRIDQSWLRARESYKNATYTLDTEVLHQWRQHSKYVFLQLKFAPALQDTELDPLRSALHELTDILGREHDLFLLEKALIQYIGLSMEERRPIHGMISKARSQCQKRAFSLAESAFSARNIPSSRLSIPV